MLIWWLLKSDGVFLTVSRINDRPDSFTLVHRTENQSNTSDIVWSKFVIPIKTLCNSDLDRLIKIETHYHKRSGNHLYIAQFFTTTQQLLEQPGRNTVYHSVPKLPTGGGKRLKDPPCQLKLIYSKLNTVYNFLDYIRGGTELACTVSIDFTASNGDPLQPDSLHYLTPDGKIWPSY